MNTFLKAGIFLSLRKIVSIIVLLAFVLTIAPVQSALALRNPQPQNVSSLSRAVGEEIQAAKNKPQAVRSYAGAIGKNEFLSLISKIDVTAYQDVKDIFLTSGTVADDIKALYDSGRLFEIFPFLREMQGITKVVSGKEGDYLTHTIGFMKYFEGILTDEAADARTNLFSKGESRNFLYEGFYQGENLDLGVWNALSDKFKDLIKTSEDRETLFLIALLHDIGTPIDVTSHDLEGEALIEAVFEHLGFSRDRIERAKWIIANHTVIGVIATRERTPKYLFDRIGGLLEEELDYRLKLLGLMAICDLRSMNDGGFLSKDIFAFYNYVLNPRGLERCQDSWHLSRLAVFESPANMGYVDKFPESSVMKQYYTLLWHEIRDKEYEAFNYNLRKFIERFDYAIRTFWKFDNKLTLLKLIYLIHRVLEEVKKIDSLELKSARVSLPPERDFGKDVKSQEENIKKVIEYLDSVSEEMEHNYPDLYTVNVDPIKKAVGKIDFSPLKTEKTLSFDIYGIPIEIDLTQPGTVRLSLKLNKMDVAAKASAAGRLSLEGVNDLRELENRKELAKKGQSVKPITPDEAALVLGPDDNVRKEMIKRLSVIYAKVKGVSDIAELKTSAEQLKNEGYTIGLVQDCTETDVDLTDSIKESIGEVKTLKTRDPNRLEEYLRQNV